MQQLSSGYQEDTTNIQADLEVDAEVGNGKRKHSFKYHNLSYLFNLFMKVKAERTDDNNSVITEAEILLSLSCVAEESTKIPEDPEAYDEVKMVRESIVFKYYDLT